MPCDPDFEHVPYLDSLDKLELVFPRSFSRCQISGFELIVFDRTTSKAYPEPS